MGLDAAVAARIADIRGSRKSWVGSNLQIADGADFLSQYAKVRDLLVAATRVVMFRQIVQSIPCNRVVLFGDGRARLFMQCSKYLSKA